MKAGRSEQALYIYISMRTSFFIIFLINSAISWGQLPKLVLPVGHTAEVRSARYSPNEKYLLTSADDYTARVWDVASSKLLYTLEDHTFYVRKAVFSPDGTQILTVSWDQTAKIWETATGKHLHTLKGHNFFLTDGAYSKDGKKIITASWDQTAIIWDASNGEKLHELSGHSEYLTKAIFSSDDNWAATSSIDGTVKVWEIITGKLLFDLDKHTDVINAIDVSPDGKKLVSVSDDGLAIVWETATGRPIIEFNEHSGKQVLSVHFSRDGNKIISSSYDSTARIWDAESGNLLNTLRGHRGPVRDAWFTPDQLQIVTIGDDSTAMRWSAETMKLLETYKEENAYPTVSIADPANNNLLIGFSNGAVRSWGLRKGIAEKSFISHTTPFRLARFTSNGKYFFTLSDDGFVRLWRTSTGKLFRSFKSYRYRPDAVKVSPDGKLLLALSADRKMMLWDIETGKLVHFLDTRSEVMSANFSGGGKYILTACIDKTAKLWETSSGKLIRTITGHNHTVQDAVFNRNAGMILTASLDKTARVVETANGKLITILSGHNGFINSAVFSKDGKFILTCSSDSTVGLWEAKTGLLIRKFNTDWYKPTAEFSPDDKTIMTLGKTLQIWNTDTRNLVRTMYDQGKASFRSSTFSPNGKYILTTSTDNKARLWQSDTGKFLKELAGHSNDITWAAFSANNNVVITAGLDSKCKMWSVASGREMCSWVAVDSTDYLAVLTSGYYQGSRQANKLLYYVTPDLKIMSFDQLDIKYNRPDKVLQSLSSRDTLLIDALRNAYYKRIKKMGIDTVSFRADHSVPVADFSNRDLISYEQSNEKLFLKIRASDSLYNLDRFNVYINEVPVFGINGNNIRKKNIKYLDTSVVITLSSGFNNIESSVINENGTDSYRIPLVVNYTPEKPGKETLRFVGIGIDKFRDPSYNLQYCVKDIRDMAKAFKSRYGKDIIVDTLFNEDVSFAKVISLKKKLMQSGVDDKIILAYSGHGLLSSQFDYYLSAYSVNFEQPQQNGIPYEELESLLDSIPARKKLMLIDACHSGEVDKEDLVILNDTTAKLIKGLKPVAHKKEGQLGLQSSFELMQSIFVNVGKSTGATIISAAAGTQFALERNDLQNGVFTFCILEAMNKYKLMKVSELKKNVGEKVKQLTNGLQEPTYRNETIAVDWNVW